MDGTRWRLLCLTELTTRDRLSASGCNLIRLDINGFLDSLDLLEIPQLFQGHLGHFCPRTNDQDTVLGFHVRSEHVTDSQLLEKDGLDFGTDSGGGSEINIKTGKSTIEHL